CSVNDMRSKDGISFCKPIEVAEQYRPIFFEQKAAYVFHYEESRFCFSDETEKVSDQKSPRIAFVPLANFAEALARWPADYPINVPIRKIKQLSRTHPANIAPNQFDVWKIVRERRG